MMTTYMVMSRAIDVSAAANLDLRLAIPIMIAVVFLMPLLVTFILTRKVIRFWLRIALVVFCLTFLILGAITFFRMF